MAALHLIAPELLPAYLATKRALLAVDQAMSALPKGRTEVELLSDAQNRLLAAQLSLAGDESFTPP